MSVLHASSQDKGASGVHGLQAAFVYVVFWAPNSELSPACRSEHRDHIRHPNTAWTYKVSQNDGPYNFIPIQ